MERVNIVVLASLVAALALAGLRLVSPSDAPDLTVVAADTGRPAFGPDGVRDRRLPASRIAMHSGGREGDKPPPGPGAPPPAEERRGAGRAGSGSSGQSAELIAGVERRRAVLSAAQNSGVAADDGTGLLPAGLLGSRAAASPQAHANGSGPTLPSAEESKRHTFEFVDDAPAEGTRADLVLSIPFNGDVKPEVGGGQIQSDGLVSKGGQVEFPDDAQLSVPAGGNVNSKAGTISFDVQPKWAGADETNNSLVQIRDEHTWENQLGIVKNFAALRYIIIDSNGVEHNVNLPIDDWSAGETHHVAATWDDSGMALYVNGQLVGQTALSNPLRFGDTTPIHIGSDFPGASYAGAGATIRDFKVFRRALGAGEISMQ